MVLEKIHNPEDIKNLNNEQVEQLCRELRAFLIKSVAKTGGHLASNLGVVELTVAIHRVFDTAKDRLVFDVGHQCYPHKILTGRQSLFGTLRQLGGLSGFPKPYESAHDAFVAGHASNSVSVALGMAHARTLLHQDYSVLALIGDGAMTGGLSFEGLNDAGASGEPMIVILNDNGMSIEANVGGLSRHLSRIRSEEGYNNFKKWYKEKLQGNSLAKQNLYRASSHVKHWLKNTLLPESTMFEKMGFSYMGPVDGHDVQKLTQMLSWAREKNEPVLLHVLTEKGRGYPYAQQDPEHFHGTPPFDTATGKPLRASTRSFSNVFGDTLLELARQDPRICAITAAMTSGTGLTEFSKELPDRFFDVGIAEGHAVAMAGGMAKQGLIPVFAVYSYAVDAWYYQLKPIRQEDFFRLMDSACAACTREQKHSLILRSKSGIVRLELEELVYCEVMGRTLTFHLNNGVVLESMGRLDDLCDQLVPYPNFLRPHRSFLINMEYIANIAARSITMQDGAEVPVPHGKYSELKNRYLSYIFDRKQVVME